MRSSINKETTPEIRSLQYFRYHLSVFIVIVALLWAIYGNRPKPIPLWFFYLSFVWGAVLVIHFITVYRLFRKKKK